MAEGSHPKLVIVAQAVRLRVYSMAMAAPGSPSNIDVALRRIVDGTLYYFRDWPNPAVPAVAAGLYSVWQGSRLIYVGMSGRGLSVADLERHRNENSGDRGLATRLASHVAGRRSGDQFCVYVADRLVLPTLTSADIEAIGAGSMSMDLKVREFIHRELSYRFALVGDGHEALTLERRARAGALGCGGPLLNPFPEQRRRKPEKGVQRLFTGVGQG